MPDPEGAPQSRPAAPELGALLAALVVGQLGLHAAMAGVRMAGLLQALREGHSAFAVGLLLALFGAAPVLTALHAGRLADRHGYHRLVHGSVILCMAGAAAALAGTFMQGTPRFALLCVAAMACGAAANVGVLSIQRTAGLLTRNAVERVRVFSWLGVAPALANVIGPVSVGFAIDALGFGAGYALMLLLPLATWLAARQVPRDGPAAAAAPIEPSAIRKPVWSLLRAPGMRRLLLVNWLLSMCWDVHLFAVPVLGHDRDYSASAVGLILGTFTLSVTLVRMLIPMLAHRLGEAVVMQASMLGTGLVLAAYPFAPNAAAMAALAALLGITLGCAQPMMMSMLHHLTPDSRHGEALALRSMTINASSTAMPLLFGATGALVGAGVLFWVVAAVVAVGSGLPRGFRQPK